MNYLALFIYPQMDDYAADEHAKTESDEGERKFDFRQVSQNH